VRHLHTAQCCITLYSAALHCTVLHYTVQCCITLYCIALHCTMLNNFALHYTILCSIALNIVLLYYTVSHTTLHCTAPRTTLQLIQHCPTLHTAQIHMRTYVRTTGGGSVATPLVRSVLLKVCAALSL
jgi:hypothetical protein